MDTVIVHKPSIAVNSIFWDPPIGSNISNIDSVVVTSITTGTWNFYSDEVFKDFYVYFLSSPPFEPPCMVTDTSFCTASFSLPLDAKNHLPGGFASTYVWSTGETTRIITVTTPGTYSVTITNACGTGTYSIIVTQANPNAPNLGVDQTFCVGDSSILTTGSTNIASCLWSTGETTNTISVDTTGSYSVYLTDNAGCSGRDTINITIIPTRTIEMCDVTYDTTYNKNSINWFVNPSETEILSVVIWVKNQFGVFVPLDTIPYSQESYIHMGSNPQADYNEYYTTAITACGEGTPSTINRSIWLTTLTNELQWQNYVGSFAPPYYVVFALMSTGTIVPMDTIPACSGAGCLNHDLIVPNPNVLKYFVAFEHTCVTNNKTNNGWVRSNYLDIVTSVHELVTIPFAVFPNPVTNQLNISIGIENFEVNIFTVLGQVVFTKYNTTVLDVNNLPQGVYIISISANDITTNKMFIKN
ncbi:MAG: T9SS type A sorting domain-containing protein [Candidatus Absconditabacterales bacterium]